MDVPTYLMMLLIALGLDVYSLIKYRKVKAPWKVLLYGSPVILIVLAINRVIEEYAPDTHLCNFNNRWYIFYCTNCCGIYYKEKAMKQFCSAGFTICLKVLTGSAKLHQPQADGFEKSGRCT